MAPFCQLDMGLGRDGSFASCGALRFEVGELGVRIGALPET